MRESTRQAAKFRWAGILLLWICCSAAIGIAAEPGFCFVQLCDPQLGMTDYKEDICSLEQAVKQVNSLAPDFLLVCGDSVHKPNKASFSDFRKIMEAVTVPCYWVAGNHDLTLRKPGDTLQIYRELFGRDYYAFTRGRFRFLVLNTQLLKTPMPIETEAQWSWVRAELEETRKSGMVPILVGHHPPFYAQPSESEAWQGLPAEPRKTLLDLCARYGVQTYLSGHTHHFVQHRYGTMDIVSGESISVNTDGHALGFRLWRVTNAVPWQSTFVPVYRRAQIVPKPAYDPANESGTAAACVAHLRLLDAVKEAIGMAGMLTNGFLIAEQDISLAIKGGVQSVVCPNQGRYRINPLGTDPECTYPGHQLPYFYEFEEFNRRAKMQRQVADSMVLPRSSAQTSTPTEPNRSRPQ
jgi:serine/threonine-protein phosphatase CPPED1